MSERTWARCGRKGELRGKTGAALVNWVVRERGERMAGRGGRDRGTGKQPRPLGRTRWR